MGTWDGYASSSLARMKRYDEKRRQSPTISGRTMPEVSDLPIGGSRAFTLAVLSIDIRGFTDIAFSIYKKNSAGLARLQAICLSEMSAVINDYKGVTEKYTGDGVLGLFGTESDTSGSTDARNAVKAALTVKLVVGRTLNPFLNGLGLPTINCGMGIDYGSVLVEKVGLRGDNQLSLSGITVSLAAKLQGAAAPGQLLIGKDILDRLEPDWQKHARPAPAAWKYPYTAFDYL